METKDIFQMNFKRLRQRKNISQKAVAEALCIAPQSVSKWERGECLPSLEFLPALARILSCRIAEFFIELATEEDHAPVPAAEILKVIPSVEEYNNADENERIRLHNQHLHACLLLMKIEMEIFNFMPTPTDMCYLTSILSGEKEDREKVIAWLVQDGVLEKHQDRYYLKNFKYSARISEIITKQ